MDGTTRPLERTTSLPYRRTFYWLIVRHRHSQMEVLTTTLAGGERALPVFSLEDEARSFLRAQSRSGWRVRKTGAGELISVLFGPCKGVQHVALDPLPEISTDAAAELGTIGRESFMEPLLGRGRSWFEKRRTRELARQLHQPSKAVIGGAL